MCSPLFIRTPSFTTRGIDEDGADAATDFGADVDMGAEDAPDGGGEVEAAVEVSDAAIGGEAAAAAAEEVACATTSIGAALKGF